MPSYHRIPQANICGRFVSGNRASRHQDRQGIPARSASKASLAKVPVSCVQDARFGNIQYVLIFERLRISIEPMAGSVPPVGRHANLHHRPPCQTRRSTYYSGTPMASATNGTKHIPRGAQRQSGGHSGIQTHGKIEKSQHPELHPGTTVSTHRPKRRFTVFIHNSIQCHSQATVNNVEERRTPRRTEHQHCYG